MIIYRLLIISLVVFAGCGGNKNPTGSGPTSDSPTPVSPPVPPTPVSPPVPPTSVSPPVPPTPEPPPEPPAPEPPAPEPPPEPPAPEPPPEPPTSGLTGSWSSTGTTLETDSILANVREWILSQNGEDLEEDDLELFVLSYTRFFNYLAIYEDGSCEIGLDVRHLVEGEDALRMTCRIDGSRLELAQDSESEIWATLNLRVDGASLVLWCSLQYYLEILLEVDPEDQTDFAESFRALFEGPSLYENQFEKVSDTPSVPPSPDETDTPAIPQPPPPPPPPTGTG